MEEEIVTSDQLEAAEVLAGLSRPSAARGDPTTEPELPRQQGVACRYNTHTTMVVTSSDKTDPQATKTVTGHLCSTNGGQSNCNSKSRPKLTEAEKEARRVRRLLANRESAREAIRRRQAMYLELKRKADDVMEENEKLKKEKELALKEYTSLRETNEFLKAQIPKAEQGKTQGEFKEMSNSISSHKQPCLMTCLCPSHSDVSQFQLDALSQQHSNITCSTQITQGGISSCSHQGPGNIRLLVVPVPWLLPFLSPSSCNSCSTQSCHRCGVCSSNGDDKNQLSSNHIVGMRASDSMRAVPGFYETADIDLVSAPKGVVRESLVMPQMKKNQQQQLTICSKKSSEKAYVTAEARRRRKELMRMKDTNHNDANKTHYREGWLTKEQLAEK